MSGVTLDRNTVAYGVGLGNIAGATLSWITWHSLAWAIVHFCFGWLYVIYWAVTHSGVR